MEKINPKKFQEFPTEIPIEVTLNCNLSCNFCFNQNAKRSSELDTISIIKIIDKIKNSGINKIRFTGGEPLLRKDIFFLLKYAKSKGFYVLLNTNGTLISERNIEKIREYVDNVLISLEGFSNESEFKSTRCKNSFEKKINAIKLMKKNKVKIVRCGTVATKENIKNLEKIFKIVKSLKVDKWELFRPIPNKKNLAPITNYDVKKLAEKLLKFKKNYKNCYIGNAIPFCSYDPEKMNKVSLGAFSDDGHRRIVISVDGQVKPSYFLVKNLGNALDTEILNCWNNDFAFKIRSLQSVPRICENCIYLNKCKGGSRFCAKLVNGSYKALDPLAQPERYRDKLFHI
ncbi:MAG: radical SAM protein [Candidatus Altiarchaeota archaeon]